jgi:hypothetical protein
VKDAMLFDPARHEPLRPLPWDERQVRAAIERIVMDAESRFTEDRYWPVHPLDREGEHATEQGETPLYHGTCGVIWAPHYLQAVGATTLSRSYVAELDRLLARNRTWLAEDAERECGSYMMGDTPIQLIAYGEQQSEELERALETLIASNVDHPARELMWGSPGTLLAALFLYELTEEQRWSDLFRLTAGRLRRQLKWSPQHLCSLWTQDLYGNRSTYLGAVQGFVATALPLIRGRRPLDAAAWNA